MALRVHGFVSNMAALSKMMTKANQEKANQASHKNKLTMVKNTISISKKNHVNMKNTLQSTLSANNFKRLQSHIAQAMQSTNNEKYDKLKNDVCKKINAIASNLDTTVKYYLH